MKAKRCPRTFVSTRGWHNKTDFSTRTFVALKMYTQILKESVYMHSTTIKMNKLVSYSWITFFFSYDCRSFICCGMYRCGKNRGWGGTKICGTPPYSPNGAELRGAWGCDLKLMAIQLTSSRGFLNFDLSLEKSSPKGVGLSTPEGPKNDENFFFQFRTFSTWFVFIGV